MKKVQTLFLASCFVAGMAMAQSGTNGVNSVNAMGYVALTLKTGDLFLATSAFFGMSDVTNTAEVMLGTDTNAIPVGVRLWSWDNVHSKYAVEELASTKAKGVYWARSTNALDYAPGLGFWIQMPTSGPTNTFRLTLKGEVPSALTSPNSTVPIMPGVNMFGYPYPIDVLWTNTDLAKNAVTSNRLWTWTGKTYSVNEYSYTKAKGQYWTDPSQQLMVGKAYWFERSAGAGVTNWNVTKPYDSP